MIIDPNNIESITTKDEGADGTVRETVRMIHTTAGAIFGYVRQEEEYDIDYFYVAQIDDEGNEVKQKSFDGDTEENFFQAVKYFEDLIKERKPPKKKEPPTVGVFAYSKETGNGIVTLGVGYTVAIPKSILDKTYSSPEKTGGEYGLLDMSNQEEDIYAPIKMPFALSLMDEESEDTIFYGMIPMTKRQEPRDTPKPPKDDEKPRKTDRDPDVDIDPDALIELLNKFYDTSDITQTFTIKELLLSNLSALSKEEIDDNFGKPLGLPADTSRIDFVNEVSKKIDEYYTR